MEFWSRTCYVILKGERLKQIMLQTSLRCAKSESAIFGTPSSFHLLLGIHWIFDPLVDIFLHRVWVGKIFSKIAIVEFLENFFFCKSPISIVKRHSLAILNSHSQRDEHEGKKSARPQYIRITRGKIYQTQPEPGHCWLEVWKNFRTHPGKEKHRTFTEIESKTVNGFILWLSSI